MPAPSIGSRPASPIQPHEEALVSRASSATKPLAEKASRGQPAGVLSNLVSRPQRTDIQWNQARLGTLQRFGQANRAALLAGSGARPLPPIPTGPRTSGAQPLPPVSLVSKGPRAGAARPLPPIPTGPRPEGPRSSTQSPAAMSPLQARIVNAQLAGQPVTSRKLEQANDAALAAALQESLDSPAHDGATSSMSPHQAGVLNALEAGDDVDADALQIADDEALAMAIAQSLDEEQDAQPAQHPVTHAAPTSAPESRPELRSEHAPSEAPPHDVAAQMKSMQDFQRHQMAITHAQQKMQVQTKGAEAIVQLTSHI